MTQQDSKSTDQNTASQDETNHQAAQRPKMVDWYSPSQLLATGVQSVASTMLGQMLDPRRLMAVEGSNEHCVFDYSDQAEFTFDYMADTGDGWDSTYTMAYLATTPSLKLTDEANELVLDRPDVLILGGDEVYPVASKTEYSTRLQNPYKQAADDVRRDTGSSRLPRNDVFMIPGNHDWYDGLGSMSQKFFTYSLNEEMSGRQEVRKRESLGQFNTCQTRGYFVLKLPENWEIWGVDIQLGNDIDPQQYSFFRSHSETVSESTRVVLCSAIPTIVYGSDRQQRHTAGRRHKGDDLTFELDRIARLAYNKGARIKVQIAGDVHNYQHYTVQKQDKNKQSYQRQQIVCGGGGAFLHPTHGFNRGSPGDPRVEPLMRYPSREDSSKLARGVLAFPFLHPGMSLLIAILYLAIFWTNGLPSLNSREFIAQAISYPGAVVLMLAVIAGCTVFAGNKKWWGAVHGITHIGAAVLVWLVAAKIAALLPFSNWVMLIERAMVLLGGFVLGGFLFGVYLWASLKFLRIHHNEAFSALGNPHYKCLLRCKLASDGSLTLHTIGVESTAGDDSSHPVKTHLVESIRVTAN